MLMTQSTAANGKDNGSHDDGEGITPRLPSSRPSDGFHFCENTFDKFHHSAPSMFTLSLDGPLPGHSVYKIFLRLIVLFVLGFREQNNSVAHKPSKQVLLS